MSPNPLALSSRTTVQLSARLSPISRPGLGHHLCVNPIAFRQRLMPCLLVVTQLRHLSRSEQPSNASGKKLASSSSPLSKTSAAAASSAPPLPLPPKGGRVSVLDRMGATRTVKIVIISILCIYGTIETIFYANVAYRYFSKESDEKE